MLPTFTQYRKWSLPSKYGFWGIVLAVIPFIWLIKDWIAAVPNYAILASNYGTSEMTIYGAAGDTRDTAVIIRGPKSHEAGISAEYYWIRRRYPGYETTFQSLVDEPERVSSTPVRLIDYVTKEEVEWITWSQTPARRLDRLTIRNWYGRTRTVYFDISSFLQKKSEPLHNKIGPHESYEEARERLNEKIRKKKEEQAQRGEKTE